MGSCLPEAHCRASAAYCDCPLPQALCRRHTCRAFAAYLRNACCRRPRPRQAVCAEAVRSRRACRMCATSAEQDQLGIAPVASEHSSPYAETACGRFASGIAAFATRRWRFVTFRSAVRLRVFQSSCKHLSMV